MEAQIETTPYINEMISRTLKNSAQIARMGKWPEIFEADSIASGIPTNGTRRFGFNAVIACALELIPQDRWWLPALVYHGWLSEEVHQIRREAREMQPNAETTWYLAAESLRREGGVDTATFLEQVAQFSSLAKTPEDRAAAARDEFRRRGTLFSIDRYGFPFGTAQGCVDAAYIHGHRLATCFVEESQTYYISTYMPRLLDSYNRRHMSCSNEEEFIQKAREVAKFLGQTY